PEAHELHRDPQLALHRDHDSALGGAVEFGEHDAGDLHGFGEYLGLAHTVLPGGGIEHQQYLGHRSSLAHHTAHLAEFVHQPGLVLQPAGGVHDHGIGT